MVALFAHPTILRWSCEVEFRPITQRSIPPPFKSSGDTARRNVWVNCQPAESRARGDTRSTLVLRRDRRAKGTCHEEERKKYRRKNKNHKNAARHLLKFSISIIFSNGPLGTAGQRHPFCRSLDDHFREREYFLSKIRYFPTSPVCGVVESMLIVRLHFGVLSFPRLRQLTTIEKNLRRVGRWAAQTAARHHLARHGRNA